MTSKLQVKKLTLVKPAPHLSHVTRFPIIIGDSTLHARSPIHQGKSYPGELSNQTKRHANL